MIAEQEVLLLGEDFLPWMVLAFGAAMVVGNVLALLRSPAPDTRAGTDANRGTDPDGRGGEATRTDEERADEGERRRPPFGRAVVMIAIGLLAAAWGLSTLLA